MSSQSSGQQEDQVTQLCEVAGVSPEEARQLLEATQWRMEDAVALHFAGGEQEEELAYRDAAAVAARDSDPSRPATAPLAPPPPPRRPPAAEAGGDGAAAEAAAAPQEQAGWFGALGRRLSDLGQVIMGVASEDFEHWFASRYGAPTPTFSKVCFGDTVKEALQERRLLLLWFHQDESSATEKLCRDIFQNELVVEMISRSFYLWAGDVGRFEPGQIARLLSVSAFPALVVCQPLRSAFDADSACLEWPLGTFAQPLFRLTPTEQGEPLAVDQAIAALTSAAEDHNDEVQAREAQQLRRSSQIAEERALREQQDREFEESLLLDQLAEVRRSEAALQSSEASPSPASASSPAPAQGSVQASSSVAGASPTSASPPPSEEARAAAAAAAAEAAKAAAVASAAEAAAEEEAKRKARGEEILAVPEPAPNGSSTAKLSLRLPSGERLQRTFSAEQRLEEVYEWAHCCRATPKPASFELCTSFPTRVLAEKSATLGSLGLAPSSALVLKADDG